MFSKRMGIVPEQALQKGIISDSLLNKLWLFSLDSIALYFIQTNQDAYGRSYSYRETINELIMLFGMDIDKFPSEGYTNKSYLMNIIRTTFFVSKPRYMVYDFLEFLVNKVGNNKIDNYNKIFQEENSAYRLTKYGPFIEITNKEELSEINQTLQQQDKYITVKNHIQTALNLFSDKTNPDYRNSIKESISAVEAVCSIITGNKSSTLGKTIKELKDKGVHIHDSLKEGFIKIYGYTSDDGGIRHAMTKGGNDPTFDEAKYMIVSCSAFVNYLIAKFEGLNK